MDPKNVRETVVGFDDEGEPLVKEMMNPAILMLEKAGKMSQKLLEALIATREAKAKDKTRKQTSMSEISARVAKKIAEAKMKQGLLSTAPVVITQNPTPVVSAPVPVDTPVVSPAQVFLTPPPKEGEPDDEIPMDLDFNQ